VPHATLHTRRLVVRPPIPDDADAIYRGYATDPEVTRWVIWTPHASIDETHAFVATFIAAGRQEQSYPWVITLAHDGMLIGAAHLRLHPPRAEVGFNIARPYWNRGLGTEAAEAVISFAIALPGIERVQAVCHVANQASARVLEKAGMQHEGTLRRYMVFPNLGTHAQDVHLYARLAERPSRR
jgi:RimJ/RimL family protein N-acetyltransferase